MDYCVVDSDIDTRYPLWPLTDPPLIHTRPMTHVCHVAHSRVNSRIYPGPKEVPAGTVGVIGLRTYKLRSSRKNTGSMLVQQQVDNKRGELSPRYDINSTHIDNFRCAGAFLDHCNMLRIELLRNHCSLIYRKKKLYKPAAFKCFCPEQYFPHSAPSVPIASSTI